MKMVNSLSILSLAKIDQGQSDGTLCGQNTGRGLTWQMDRLTGLTALLLTQRGRFVLESKKFDYFGSHSCDTVTNGPGDILIMT